MSTTSAQTLIPNRNKLSDERKQGPLQKGLPLRQKQEIYKMSPGHRVVSESRGVLEACQRDVALPMAKARIL